MTASTDLEIKRTIDFVFFCPKNFCQALSHYINYIILSYFTSNYKDNFLNNMFRVNIKEDQTFLRSFDKNILVITEVILSFNVWLII
jgi:hypothetical protein